MSKASDDVLAERERQKSVEGWTETHDDEHYLGEIACAAAAYAMHANRSIDTPSGYLWPWDATSFKPKDERSNLVRAGALILAEIERLDRSAAMKGTG